ncbi:MAG: DUF4249 family protein [Bacteroidota bacterium]
MKRAVIFAIALAAAFGCSEDFNPTTSGPRPYVVFAILNPALDTQIVRIHATSAPTDANPRTLPVPDASVVVLGPTGTIPFQLVDLPGTPGTPDSVIPAFRAAPFRPIRGASYTLVVTTTEGIATGTLEVPDFSTGTMIARDFVIIQQPHTYPLDAPITIASFLARQTLGYMVQFQIEYEVLKNATWELEYREVPTAYVSENGPTDFVALYPKMVRRSASAMVGSGLQTSEMSVYLNRAYEKTISLIHAQYGSANIRMRRAVFLLQQADRHFFTYYSFANSFQDRFTIRVDQPDYSNINGALGFFGSLAIDTLAYALPINLRPR